MDTLHPTWLIVGSVVLAVVPMLVGLATSYTKMSIVFGMLRSGLGAQQVPSALVVMALSLALSVYVMAPVAEESFRVASGINLSLGGNAPTLSELQRFQPLLDPWRAFMQKHAGERELKVLLELSSTTHSKGAPTDGAAVLPSQDSVEQPPAEAVAQRTDASSLRVLLPAFILTEVKEAFAMAFVLLLPFLAIDLIVSNILAGMGMMMVSPTMISLPLKLILFVVSDGWLLLSKGLIFSYQVGNG